ncbi:hypothetical protein M758_1G035500 [Ceratodon purpureus]|uniref:Uncharacterized protein n=1 Tax=Ceratodon purpureus TaxID=3225 RepID=A0A8T0J3F4_CERPU|nr:hypothetical protein KC19_1G037400 [Ceratodon purpureus]KAG0628551.1 hypothetical protein M758_1G035500 [Ceratodon purpureus]KAG0628552.1 hypothetical protein M758_1G035500 [Ceratodon purpureus]KAG0628553.1 hypothetical protein M758_1G035500 [Ceratodon purpureus]KAG0628554.1 hypothetical protein M758_1G035500 [Ceratodon purpureus]
MSESSLAELMRREDSGLTNMRSCWHTGRPDLVETPDDDWWGLESPTTYPHRSSPYDHGFEVLAKPSSSKTSPGGSASTLFSCFRQSSPGHMTEPDLEPSTPPRREMLLVRAPCTSMRSSSANDNVTKFMEVEAADSHHGHGGYESDQLHIYSDEEPTSPVVNCIGQVRPKKKPKQRCDVAKKSDTDAAARTESLMLQGAKLYSLQLASPMRSASAAVAVPEGTARCKSGGKWKQLLLQRSSSASSVTPS